MRRKRPVKTAAFVVRVGRRQYGSETMPRLEFGHLVLTQESGLEYLPVVGRRFTIESRFPMEAPDTTELGVKMRRALRIGPEGEREIQVQEFNEKRNRSLTGLWGR